MGLLTSESVHFVEVDPTPIIVAIVSGFFAFLGVLVGLIVEIRKVKKQVHPNGGASMADKMNELIRWKNEETMWRDAETIERRNIRETIDAIEETQEIARGEIQHVETRLEGRIDRMRAALSKRLKDGLSDVNGRLTDHIDERLVVARAPKE